MSAECEAAYVAGWGDGNREGFERGYRDGIADARKRPSDGVSRVDWQAGYDAGLKDNTARPAVRKSFVARLFGR